MHAFTAASEHSAAMPATPARFSPPMRRIVCRCIPIVLMALGFFSGLSWSGLNSGNTWNLQALCSCPEIHSSNDTISSELDHLPEILLPSMKYAQPNTMSQPRTDVLTMTPWFAPIIWDGTYNLDILNEQFRRRNVTIGLAVVAIKKYVVFLQRFIETAEKFFMVGHKVNYYVLTDRPEAVPNITLGAGRQVVTLRVPAFKRWQDICLARMQMVKDASRETFIHQVEYIVVADLDMQFSDLVGVEILGDLFGTLHPGFYSGQRQHFTYERRSASEAYIPQDEGDFYYAAGFFGGTVKEIYKLTTYCYKGIIKDKEHGIEAVWHEESHMNKYFIYHKPTKILSPEYLWDNRMGSRAVLRKRRFVSVPKNHDQIRNK